MGARKTLKTGFLLWVFAVGLSSASSRFQDEKNLYFYYTPFSYGSSPPPFVYYQNPPPLNANDPPAVSYKNPPPARANDPPVVSSCQTPPPANNPPPAANKTPPAGNVSPPSHKDEHHQHPPEHKPVTQCFAPPPPSGYADPPLPSPMVAHSPPSQSPGVGPIESSDPTRSGNRYYPTPSITPSTDPAIDPPSTSPSTDPPSTPSTTPYTDPRSTSSATSPSTTHSTEPPSITPANTPPVPGNTFPSPPSSPNIPFIGGTCDFWRTHPHLLSDLLISWWRATLGRTMGLSGIPGIGSSMSFQEALSNTRNDGIGALYREGTASLLNSMVNNNFPFTTSRVADLFVVALASDKVAAAQAQIFKLANEGRLKQ
ncbi:hypothetical protein R6Q59_006504 [Mikania micrantha]|uniref:Uncharacterized protein n=1 Tax=Mikania micrantha TaxID=192012 RepID=A0A5N6PUK1_9ASTR|nr:hypothetical protein E3N88_04045 [Mikania micrantha]